MRKLLYLVIGGILLFSLAAFISISRGSSYLRAAEAGGDYLTRHLLEDGSFVYEYDPVEREVSDSYNMLRHAGTTYSLLELYEATGNESYLHAAERALEYLRASIVPCPAYPDAMCMLEDDEIKIGGNGLALIAFTKYMELTGSRDDLELGRGLARFITSVQKEDGELSFFKMDGDGVPDSEFVSLYYPGEAYLGLARLAVLSGEREWMDAAHAGARWVITVRDVATPTEKLEHDHWMLYAINELHADNNDALYVEHAQRLTKAITATQHRDMPPKRANWEGGYYKPPRTAPTATRNEGLGAAYAIFTRAGHRAYAEVARDAMERGVEFALRTQFTQEKIRETGAAADAEGGFHYSLDAYAVRIDYVQHNISALLALDRIERGL